ncbi:hypothetical protein IQ06DRAFT_290793 [Phaeosphaeriaceae sp. SRC1lsM3a]|nr:hypothetical protein IQ06DRAFT_290793 [Stagonospora sp. SRC1lsM3a]
MTPSNPLVYPLPDPRAIDQTPRPRPLPQKKRKHVVIIEEQAIKTAQTSKDRTMMGHAVDIVSSIEKEEAAVNHSATKKRKRAEKKAKSAQEGIQTNTYVAGKEAPCNLESDIEHPAARPSKRVKIAGEAAFKDEVVTEDGLQQDHPLDNDEVPSLDQIIKTKNTASKKAKPAPNDAEIRTLLAGIASIPSDAWTHPTISPDYCLIIKWFDKDRLDVHTIADKYGKLVDPKTNKTRDLKGAGVDKGIYKHYAKYGPIFYEAKGLPWVSKKERNMYETRMKNVGSGGSAVQEVAGKGADVDKTKAVDGGPKGYATHRGAPKASSSRSAPRISSGNADSSSPPYAPSPSKQKGKGKANAPEPAARRSRSSSPEETPLDRQVRALFVKTFTKRRAIPKPSKNASKRPNDNGPSANDIARYHQNRNSKDLIHFKRESGDAILGDPSWPVLDRQCAARYSYPIEELLEAHPGFGIIEYEGISQSAVRRFVAWVSPTLRSSLPTHDISEVVEDGVPALRTTPIQWSMLELVELYRFTMELGANHVCDMVLDRWLEELHRPERRMLWNKDGEIEFFDIMDIGPEFLNHLAERNDEALDFFTDLLVMKKQDGWEVLDKYGVLTSKDVEEHGQFSWKDDVKKALVEKLGKKEEIDLLKVDADDFCTRFHHHYREGGGECYKVQALVDESAVTDKNSAAAAQETTPATPRKLDPVALYWKHQEELFEEQRMRTAEASEGISIGAFEDRAYDRREEQKALRAEEKAMAAITISIVPRAYIPEQHDKEGIHSNSRDLTFARPVDHAGITYPDHLGNRRFDGMWQAHAKFELVRSKLQEFEDAGYYVGDLGTRNEGEDVDVEGQEQGDDVEDEREDGGEEGEEDEDNW